MTDTMWITGQKVSLRLMTRQDTPLIVRWRNNPRVRDNFIYREPFTPQTHENWIRTHVEKGDVVQLIICENNPGRRPVGSVYYRDIDRKAQTAEYGIFIGEDDATGKGYGNETAQLATDWAFAQLHLQKIFLRVFSDNVPARRSYEHAGFHKIQDLPNVTCSDGTERDMILMSMERG